MAQIEDEAARWDGQIIDLEHRIVEQKSRIESGGGGFGSLEVLHFMEQTLQSWLEHKRALQIPPPTRARRLNSALRAPLPF